MKKENIDFLSGLEAVLSHRPAKMLWMIPTFIGILVVMIILWLTISQIDVIAPAQGKTIPNSRMVLIQPKDISIIDKIYVKNGQSVKKGDLLVDFKDKIENFENNSVNAKYKNLIAEKLFLDNYISYIKTKKISKISSNKDLPLGILAMVNSKLSTNISAYENDTLSFQMKIQKIDFEKKMVESELSKQQKLLPYTKHNLEQLKELVLKGYESEMSLQDMEKEYIKEDEDIKIKIAEKNKLQAQLNISKKELEQFKNNTLKDLLKRENEVSNELTTLEPEVDKSNYILGTKSIKATVDGTIYNLTNSNKDKVVQSGEVIMKLIPNNTPLEVEAKVLNKDIGFISIGQKVKVKLDSFKFTKYGYIEGEVINIEKASILDEKLGEIYPVIIRLSTDIMKVDNKFIKLIPGMTCSVDIKIGKRRLIDYIISPMIRYKDEALREK
ncbi:secretion protein HlyD family protein [Arcobacter nitrofigilis DSM 7299]|uniref:Secretion protein HlyD family protein n=1 Tax=Arcobacter nitrofigilis (strain ATCC 33309 / DSM 7299 / CCUG 15893 / LMG 7604 / NCTC 12251 / CI) TaxID=572480 RepID=D5V5Y8_ARCNC|nr:HlyD family type I secretion periplasmic adaptor subunit [Arcobacter nitrofigilis]ADG93155.1 secretion protein HlyD family protein [Arcobacter nitrofigilis DSM 7299]